jgi:1,4-alpha-glucan branching enzyme
MWGYPGKKLLFMGQEFAQWSEWSEKVSLDWNLLQYHMHEGMRRLVRDLNFTYRSKAALHARDCEPEGFEWLMADDHDNSVLAWLRRAPGEKPVAVISNLTPVYRENFYVPLPAAGRWREILNTDAEIYGGTGKGNGGRVQAVDAGGSIGATLTLPPLAVIMLELEN